MLLGAWGKSLVGGGGGRTAGGAPMNPTTPVVPSNAESFPGGGAARHRRRTKLRFVALITAFALYLILGASIFSTIEAPAIEAIANNVDQLRAKFLKRHPIVKGEWKRRELTMR